MTAETARNPGQPPGTPVVRVREDLTIAKGGATAEGDSTWTVHDPLTQRFHELDKVGYALLCEAPFCFTLEEAASRASAVSGVKVEPAEVESFLQQLEAASLTVKPRRGWRELWLRRQARHGGAAAWLLQNYLFIRAPLVRPDTFLDATLPFARMFWGKKNFLITLSAATIAGLYLVSRQWDEFTHTFMRFLTLEGAGGYLAALIVLKALHELGHAYAAKRFGCRVPTMGVAFVVLTPLLYTDVTEIWRLTSRRERMIVDLAGIAVELGVAGLATLFWCLLPAGLPKSVCFFAATTSWVSSVLVNLSPLMRFDGYYVFSDLINVPNLQQRAFALLRWRIRRLLFGLEGARLENWSASRENLVFGYGLVAALYRLVLFTSIAIFVYEKTFKALGILLFLVEMGWFVIRPVGSEIRIWWELRSEIANSPRSRISLGFLGVVVALVAIPWSGAVEVPAVVEPGYSYRLTTTASGLLARANVAPGMAVSAGQILFQLESPALDAELRRTQSRIDLLKYRLSRRTADQADLQEGSVLERELAAVERKSLGLERERRDLVIRATAPGRVVDLEEDLHVGRWIAKGEILGVLVSDGPWQVRGYADERSVSRVAEGALGRFIPDDLLRPGVDVRLTRVSTAPANNMDLQYLSSAQGGGVYMSLEKNHLQEPLDAEFAITFSPVQTLPWNSAVVRGTVQVDGARESVLSGIGSRILSRIIRESGF